MVRSVIIIGAGFGGLAAACLLRQQGYAVTLLERHEQPGGRARAYVKDGFTFDMGPSWYLMPEVFERFFAHFDRVPTDFYELTRLDPSYRMYFGSDDRIDISSDLKRNMRLFESIEPGAGERLQQYLDRSKFQYDAAMDKFIYRNYETVGDLLDPKLASVGMRMRLFDSLDRYTRRFFDSDRLRKILEYTVVFLGGDPTNTPALYSLMSHVDFNLGVWYPTGGMHAVAQAMADLATELGVDIRYGSDVKRIIVKDGHATGVRLADGTKVQADIVVCNGDYHAMEQNLLGPSHRQYSKKYWEKRTVAPSGFVMFLGLDKRIKGLEHHTLFLEEDWQEHFTEIFRNPKWPDRPSFYVCAPSKTDSTVAPDGKENLFVLVPVAAGLEDTEDRREKYADMILDRMEAATGESIREHIEVKRVYAHADFIRDYDAFKGTALGLAHTLRQTALLRPRMRSRKVKDLWFVGQYTHPGIGVPMVVIAAEILAKEVARRDH